jgi:hypothetical protein
MSQRDVFDAMRLDSFFDSFDSRGHDEIEFMIQNPSEKHLIARRGKLSFEDRLGYKQVAL